jgi:hypothetical protein
LAILILRPSFFILHFSFSPFTSAPRFCILRSHYNIITHHIHKEKTNGDQTVIMAGTVPCRASRNGQRGGVVQARGSENKDRV